jgi:hypothetical protein
VVHPIICVSTITRVFCHLYCHCLVLLTWWPISSVKSVILCSFPSFYSFFLPKYCMCRGLLLRVISHSETCIVGRIPWTSDRLVVEACTCNDVRHSRETNIVHPVGFEPAIPEGERFRPRNQRDRLCHELRYTCFRLLRSAKDCSKCMTEVILF